VKDPQQAEQNWSDTVRESLGKRVCWQYIQLVLRHLEVSGVDPVPFSPTGDEGIYCSLNFVTAVMVLERGDGGCPVDHLAFIGLVQQPLSIRRGPSFPFGVQY
jgi:hypothetical protein